MLEKGRFLGQTRGKDNFKQKNKKTLLIYNWNVIVTNQKC